MAKLFSSVSERSARPSVRRPFATLGEISASTIFAHVAEELDRRERTSKGTCNRYDGFMRAVKLEKVGMSENLLTKKKRRRLNGDGR